MSKYAKGANFEREIVKDLRSRGYWCIRAAGSHGKVDVLAIKLHQKEIFPRILMIQAKTDGRISLAEWNEVYHTAKALCCVPILACCIPILARKDGSTIEYREMLAEAKPREKRGYDPYEP